MRKNCFFFLLIFSLAACGETGETFRGYDVDGDGSPADPGATGQATGTPGGNQSESPSPDLSGATALGCRARGFNFVCWYRNCFQEDETAGTLDTIRTVGARWIEIVPTWYQNDVDSNQIYEHPDKSPTAADLRALVPLARQKGFQFVLKPHIDLVSGAWRGVIEPQNLAVWQASYEDYILTFASLAQELGIEVLVIGTELKTRSGDSAFWRGLIPKIRQRYTGLLTYAANWDEYTTVSFWDLLDQIGIDFYFPLTDDPNAGQTAMEAGLMPIRDQLKQFSEQKSRPFLLTEIGYRSLDGMNLRPFDYQLGGAIDLQEQADAYAAVLTVFNEQESWLEGIFWWNAEPILKGGEDDDGYSPFGKPAADILKTFWGGDSCPDASS